MDFGDGSSLMHPAAEAPIMLKLPRWLRIGKLTNDLKLLFRRIVLT